VASIAESEEVRSVLVHGAGPRFCGGGDLKAMLASDDRLTYVRTLAVELDLAFQDLAALSIPVVAAVHGSVAGAGLALMLSCDIIVAASDTQFVPAYPGVALTPDCGLSWLLPRAIGQQRALAFLLRNEHVNASVAEEWGLVASVVSPEDLEPESYQTARALAEGPAWAFGQTRDLVRRSFESSRADAGVREADVVTAAANHSDARERMERFGRR
jgi:2-(1,2-epoxy-1,2-dihydrophenyl)acetyl-CoA isomerase